MFEDQRQHEIDNSTCLFDPSYEMEGLCQKNVSLISRCQSTSLYAVQSQSQINVYNPSDLKIVYHDANMFQNQMLKSKKLKIQAQLGLTNSTSQRNSFEYSLFHNLDGGLLFASDFRGNLHYYDMNSLLTRDKLSLPAASFHVAKNSPIHHLSLPQYYSHHSLFGMSLGLTGGFALFDVKQGEKTLQLKDIHAVQTKYYPENTNYIGVVTVEGSLELYDVRNMSGLVAIYNEEFHKEEKLIQAKEQIEKQMKEQLSQMKRDYFSTKKRSVKEESKHQLQDQHMLKYSLDKSFEQSQQTQKTVNNIDHFIVNFTSDKSKYIRFRNSIQVTDQITDFDFHSSTKLIAINRAGVMKHYDFYSTQLEHVNSQAMDANEALQSYFKGYKLVPTYQERFLPSSDEDSNFTSLDTSKHRKDYMIQSPNKIILYDVKRDTLRQECNTHVTAYNSLMLEGDSLNFNCNRYLNSGDDEDVMSRGGFLVSTSSIYKQMASEQQSTLSGYDNYQQSNPFSKMFIGGLSPNTTDFSLRSYFAQYGEIADSVIMRDKDSNSSRGFGFVTFTNPIVLQQFLRLQPHVIDGKQVDCKMAVPKEQPVVQPVQQPQFQSPIQQQPAQQLQQNPKKGKKAQIQNNQQAQSQAQKLKNQSQQYQKQIQKQMQMLEEQKQQMQMFEKQRQDFAREQQNYYSMKDQAQAYTMPDQGMPNGINQSALQNLDNQRFSSSTDEISKQIKDSSLKVLSTDTTSNDSLRLKDESQSQIKMGDMNKSSQGSSHHSSHSSESLAPVVQPQLEAQYRKIFVGGLPHNLSDEEFRAYFIQFGEIEDCAILKDKRTGKPRGFGFVTYKNVETLDTVMDNKDKHTIQGKWVDCKRAVPANQIKDVVQPIVKASPMQRTAVSPVGLTGVYQQNSITFTINVLNPQIAQPVGMKAASISPQQSESNGSSMKSTSPEQSNFKQDSQPFFKPSQQKPSPNANYPVQAPPGFHPIQGHVQHQGFGYPYMNHYQQNMYGISPNPMQPQMYMPPQQQPNQINQGMSPDMQNFKIGYTYSQTFKQHLQQNQQFPHNYQNHPHMMNSLQAQLNNHISGFGQPTEQMQKQHQEETEWHIQSLNKEYSSFNKEDNDNQVLGLQKDKEGSQTKKEESQNKLRQETIQSLNDQIQQIELRKSSDEEEKVGSQISQVDWKQGSEPGISGFYTQQQNSTYTLPKNNRLGVLGSTDSSSNKSQPENEDILKAQSPFKAQTDNSAFGIPLPQEEIRFVDQQKDQQVAPQPQLKRVESEGRIGQGNDQDVSYQPERRHILGSGANFQFGKDRPSSRHSNDKVNVKAEYGKIKSQQTQGPSNRADRSYKPY